MVKVISVHHFLSQDVTTIPGPTAVTLAGQNILLMATENLQVEVRDLKAAGKVSHTFPTIGKIEIQIIYPAHRFLQPIPKLWIRIFTSLSAN